MTIADTQPRLLPGTRLRVTTAGAHLRVRLLAWEVIEDRGDAGVRIGGRGEDGTFAAVIWVDRHELEVMTDA